jgi:hypothetical protein
MSGEGATPVVLDEQTRLLVKKLVHSAKAARATYDTVAHADAARDGAEPIAGGDAVATKSRTLRAAPEAARYELRPPSNPVTTGTVELSLGATAEQRASQRAKATASVMLRIRPSAAAGTKSTGATTSGRASKPPSTLTRTTRSTSSPKPFSVTSRFVKERAVRDARAKETPFTCCVKSRFSTSQFVSLSPFVIHYLMCRTQRRAKIAEGGVFR